MDDETKDTIISPDDTLLRELLKEVFKLQERVAALDAQHQAPTTP